MEPSTASYYRAILFLDPHSSNHLPKSLIQLHTWTAKRNQALGLSGTVSKQTALSVAITWISSTAEGREFVKDQLPGLFSAAEPPEAFSPDGPIDWEKVPANTKVVVTVKDKLPVNGEFVGQRQGVYIDVQINGEKKSFRSTQVQLIGA